jgi:glycosyltransferase involved in cell wall biosynthesis
MNLDFSIITVSYNSEKTIERTIKSVLNQSYKNYEYIIIDGGSTDKTNDIINSYKNEFLGGIIHISEPDKGIYDAMNKGISLANGNIIGLLNSDDYYFEKTLSIVYKSYCETNKETVLTGELIFKSEAGEQLMRTSKKRFIKKTKQFKNGVRHPATFVPRIIYNNIGLFNLDYKIASDAEFIFRMYKSNYDFKFINQPLLVMSDGGISNSKGIFKQLIYENRILIKAYCPNFFLRIYYTTLSILRLMVKEVASNLTFVYRKIENQ